LLSIADDLAASLSALKIRVQPYDPKTSLVSPEKARENLEKEIDRLLDKAVYFQRHAHAALLGRCVLGADSNQDCSTEGARLQLNVWDDTTRRDIVEDGTTGCVAHTIEAARRAMADRPAARSCSPSSMATKGQPSAALSDWDRMTPTGSCTTA
jgi:hypothetical protein